MRILGIDASLSATGWARLQDGELEDLGVIKTAPVDTHLRIDRMVRIVEGISERCDVQLAAIEGYAFSRSTSALYSGELGGILRLHLMKLGVQWSEISPGTWRKLVLGRGNMPKDICRLELAKRYGVEHPDMNALEAFAVGMCAHLLATGQTMPAIRRGKVA